MTTPVILIGLRFEETEEAFRHALKELESLCEACDLEVRDIITQTCRILILLLI